MAELKLPRIIGHRGAKAYAPENTLVSIHTAADMGIEWVELDVKLTKDHVPVIFHDEELGRCTNISGLMIDTDFATVKELDAGSWFSESFMGEKIPTLEEALDVIIDRKLGLNLEIKPCPGREIETASIALDVLARVWDEDMPLLISSFSHVSLETSLDIIPEFKRGFLMDEYMETWKEFDEYLQLYSNHVNPENLTHAQLEEFIEHGKPVLTYTVNEPIKAINLFNMGVTSVFSDCPDVIRDELESFH